MVEVGGLVLGISNTLVIPPAIAALLPECKSSVSVEPGSLKCTCVSIHPGKTINPFAPIEQLKTKLKEDGEKKKMEVQAD